MPKPGVSLGTLRPDISQVLLPYSDFAWKNGFVADLIYPAYDVDEVNGIFPKVDGAAVHQNVDTKRGADGRYNQVTWEWSQDGWNCVEYGLEERVDRRDASRFRSWFDMEVEAAKRCRRLLMLEREKRIAAKVFNASSYSPTNITNEWDDTANATPVADVHAAVQRLLANGIEANAIVMNKSVYNNCRVCDEVREVLSASGAGDRNAKVRVGVEQLRQVFDLEYVLVGGAHKNTADEGLSAALAPVWSNEYVAVCRIASDDDFSDPCVGRTFHYTPDGSQIGGVQESYYDESRRSDIVRTRFDLDEMTLVTNAVELLANATT